MASRVQDAAFLTAAVIALIAFGLLILVARPTGPAAETSAAPSVSPSISFSPLPSITIAIATVTPPPATTAPPTPVPPTAAPTTAAPRTVAPTRSP